MRFYYRGENMAQNFVGPNLEVLAKRSIIEAYTLQMKYQKNEGQMRIQISHLSMNPVGVGGSQAFSFFNRFLLDVHEDSENLELFCQ
jgi:hypothetical protein